MFRSFTARVFLVSVVALYLEMVAIRLLASEIRLLAYTSNFVLVVCFFSLGYGFLRQQAPGKALWRSGMASTGLFLFPYLPDALGPLHPRLLTGYLSRFQDFVIWFQEPSAEFAEAAREIALGLLILLVLCFLLLTALAPLGSILGQLFARSDRPKLTSYSANIVGSIGGVVLFSLVSWLWLKPYWWAIVLAAMFLLMVLQFRPPQTAEEKPPRRGWLPALIAVSSVLVALVVTGRLWEQNHDSSIIWSSYHRVDIEPLYEYEALEEHFLKISVNGAFIMGIYNLSPEFLARAPQFAQRARERPAHFDYPYLLSPGAKDVLILGAGAGNDVAAALRAGVPHIDAVEIDEAFVTLGERHHPEKPYDSERVNVIIDDARSFLQRTDRQYDIIAFGLLDAHRLSNAASNVRLDNFVYTAESIRMAASRLKEGGLLYLSFFPSKPFIGERMQKTLVQEYGRENVATYDVRDAFLAGTSNALVTVASSRLDAIHQRLAAATHPSLRIFRARRVALPSEADFAATEDLTDNWPYFHLEKRTIPQVYLLLYGLVIVCGGVLLFRRGLPPEPRLVLYFLFGAAFMLLETHVITKAALLLGSTWLTFSYVIVGILLFILAANGLVARGLRANQPLVYGLLGLSLLANYFIPLSSYLHFPFAVSIAAYLIMSTLPILCAGILFATYFDHEPNPAGALALNLLGGLCGGMLESLSFVFGLRTMLLVALALYLAAFLVSRSKSWARA